MRTDVEIPKLDWLERYKRVVDAAWTMLLAYEDFVYRKWGTEALADLRQYARPEWSGVIAKRLVEKLGLKPDIEGAMKLFRLYSQEVWGFGDAQFFEDKLVSPTKGSFSNLICRGWEKEREHHKETRCDLACAAEYGGVLRTLSPTMKVTVTKAFPRGDDRCEYTVEI
ncbi:hypothetical protein ACFLV4_05540 [Chloroflexota bacterium]